MSKSVHFIGIGGIGMSGLAKIILENGGKVSGSDLKESAILDALRSLGAQIQLGHAKGNLPNTDCVVVNSDIRHDNPEIHRARELSIPIIHRSDLLKELAEKQEIISITGTHGKTTTSSLLAHVALSAKTNSGYAVGGIIKSTGTNAQHGNGRFFILEADESDGTFLKYNYRLAVVTNVDTDHMAHYGSMDNLKKAFKEFITRAHNPQSIFVCGEDPFLAQFHGQATLYGFHEGCGLRARNVRYERNGTWMDIEFRGSVYTDVISPLYGEHNVLNALAIFGLCLEMGLTEEAIRAGFSSFMGVNRRLDLKGDQHDLLIFDDYGHHPTEVRATLKALRQKVGGRKIRAVFQPHRYSRMQYILNEFAGVFDEADEVVITDLFTAGETPVLGCSTKEIFDIIQAGQKNNTQFVCRSDLVETLAKQVRPHEAVIFFGAGDSTKAAQDLSSMISKEITKIRVGLVFGGENSEHLISKISAQSVGEQLDRTLYELQLFEISSQGHWNCVEKISTQQVCYEEGTQRISPDTIQALQKCDLFIPILHGPRGEDGTVQGFFEILGKPYTGCSVVSAACSMDKAKTKWLAEARGIPVVPFVEVRSEDWERRQELSLREIAECLTFPLMLKPAHLGSSVGIEKVVTMSELRAALTRACLIDRLVVVEECIQISHEIEYAVLGNEDPIITSPGEICTGGQIYDYAAKYGSSCFSTSLTPQLSSDVVLATKKIALDAYRAVDCRGMARVDLFIDMDGKIYLNEVNPIPGFTAISLYPQLWKHAGKKYPILLQELICLAFEQFWNEKRTFQEQICLGKKLEKVCAT